MATTDTNTRYEINKSTGAVTRITETRERIRLLDEMLQACMKDVSLKAMNVLQVPKWGPASLVQSNDELWWTVPLDRISIRAPFKTIKGEKASEKVLVPNFSSGEDPVITVEWRPMPTMRLRFLAQMPQRTDHRVVLGYAYLFAYAENGSAYKLPLPNIYEDCRVCDGQSRSHTRTHSEQLEQVLNEFASSVWNSDLWTHPEDTHSLFRFKATNSGFEQLSATNNNWTALCQKVSTDIMKWVVV